MRAFLRVAGDGPETKMLRERSGPPMANRSGSAASLDDEARVTSPRRRRVPMLAMLRGESCGMVVLEGMAAQTPVSQHLPGYRNVARWLRRAVFVPPGDVGALAGAIADVANPSAAEALGRLLLPAAPEEFSMDNLARRYLDLYTSL